MSDYIRTIYDAHKAGLQLVAICRNIACRHRRPVDLRRVSFSIGRDAKLLPEAGHPHFSDKLRCPLCGYRGMFIWPMGITRDPEYVSGEGMYTVRAWHRDSLLAIVARARHEGVAHAAFDFAIGAYPRDRLTLQEGMRVMRDSRFNVIGGGKK